MRSFGMRILCNRWVLVSGVAVALIRVLQFLVLNYEGGSIPSWDILYRDFTFHYVAMLVVVPYIALAMRPFSSLLDWERALTRFPSRDGYLLHFAKMAALLAGTCSLWMSLVSVILLLICCPDLETILHILPIILGSSLLQMIFFITCSCLFILGLVVGRSSLFGLATITLYASLDMVIDGIPALSRRFLPLGWGIVQAGDQLSSISLIAMCIIPLFLATLSICAALLFYRSTNPKKNPGDSHAL